MNSNGLTAPCFRCRSIRTMQNITLKRTPTNKAMAHGVCPQCNTHLTRMVPTSWLP